MAIAKEPRDGPNPISPVALNRRLVLATAAGAAQQRRSRSNEYEPLHRSLVSLHRSVHFTQRFLASASGCSRCLPCIISSCSTPTMASVCFWISRSITWVRTPGLSSLSRTCVRRLARFRIVGEILQPSSAFSRTPALGSCCSAYSSARRTSADCGWFFRRSTDSTRSPAIGRIFRGREQQALNGLIVHASRENALPGFVHHDLHLPGDTGST